MIGNNISIKYNDGDRSKDYINLSATKATLNLTNSDDIDNKRFLVGTVIPIEGRIYNELNDSGYADITVSLNIDGILYDQFNDTTNATGYFSINYRIPENLNVYTSHIINASVIDSLKVYYNNFFTIFVNITSYFEVEYPDRPLLSGENCITNGYLRYGNGTGISNKEIYYGWYNGSSYWGPYSIMSSSDGSIPDIPTPLNIPSQFLNLYLNFSIPDRVNFSQTMVPMTIFQNITVLWDISTNVRVNEELQVKGQVIAKGKPSLKIYNRSFRLIYDGTEQGSFSTDSNGNFSYNFVIPTGTGNRTLSIRLIDEVVGFDLGSRVILNVTQPISPPAPPFNITPFQMFFLVGIPIIIGIIAALGIGGYIYYKKKISASRRVNIPLEGKIRNLKILKDSGRMEEALSYLFNAIYMELAGAKFGRTRRENETIRDFAIVSVQDFNLDPSKIYPFIQKIEQIIYSRPHKISEEDFYKTIELFSPVYYQLTGYNFILNF